jgi:hypothetical protein
MGWVGIYREEDGAEGEENEEICCLCDTIFTRAGTDSEGGGSCRWLVAKAGGQRLNQVSLVCLKGMGIFMFIIFCVF